jgi:membrane-bound lytic murein transglycosylase A
MQIRTALGRAGLALCFAAGAMACASTPRTPAPIVRPGSAGTTTRPPVPPNLPPTQPPVIDFALAPATFADLPNWASVDLVPAMTAFKRQCNAWRLRAPEAAMGGRYGGTMSQWRPACDAAATTPAGYERWFFETYFDPQLVSGPGDVKLTSYYEPIIEARRYPSAPFTEPLLRVPSDLVTVDLQAFAEAYDSEALRGGPRSLNGKMIGGRIEPYPKREAITQEAGQVIAYAHPADVYNLQVQGSGRLNFGDGTEARAQFAAQNGYKWSSALGALRSSGQLASATWTGFRSWLDSNPQSQRAALNADPSYVFFQEETISDPTAGPRGSAGVPLTAQGSIAVDPAYHPYGAIVFVDGTYDGGGFQRLLVAQDTGGAIRRGPLRGDVFWGSGPAAGQAAEKMNGPARWWTLIPKPFAPAGQVSAAPASPPPNG